MFTRKRNNSAPQRRPWLRFSLRTLLLVVTVFGVWLGVKVDQARRQKRAVETLKALGADIRFEHQRVPQGGFDGRIELDVPTWARELCGDDFFQTVTGVYFWHRGSQDQKQPRPRAIRDEDLECLADLPHLEVLHIDKAPITDAGLSHIAHPERLTSVTLSDTRIGDGFVQRLKGAERLRALWIDNTDVTDSGLAELSGVTTIKRLSLLGTKTGDQGLAAFRECRQLEALKPGRNVTDKGIQQFETLENVKALVAHCQITGDAFRGFRLPKADSVYLVNCPIGDDDLRPLVEAMRDVRLLLLEGCPITDVGLQHLEHLGKIQILQLTKTKIQGHELHNLSSLSGLAALVVSGCPLDEPDLQALAPLYTGTASGGNLTLDETPITDDDLAKISGFTNLQYLGLRQTKISDAGLPHLHKLTKLLRLDVRGTHVTAWGVRQLKETIRGLKVAWDEDAQPEGWRR